MEKPTSQTIIVAALMLVGGLMVGYGLHSQPEPVRDMSIATVPDHMQHSGIAPDSTMEHEMDAMTALLEGKTGAEFDQIFLEQMIVHHQGAVEMAEMALEHAQHEELKKMAREIIAAQTKEIDLMKEWEMEWTQH